jgi:hypothetical protein
MIRGSRLSLSGQPTQRIPAVRCAGKYPHVTQLPAEAGLTSPPSGQTISPKARAQLKLRIGFKALLKMARVVQIRPT